MTTPVAPTVAYLGLGSNLGDREAAIAFALDALAVEEDVEVLRVSTIIETEPLVSDALGVPAVDAGGSPYLNAVVAIRTTRSPRELLDSCLGIEARCGRHRPADRRWAPRTLDIDLLLYGEDLVDEAGLRVPHPHLHERAFVLGPLCEIAPLARHPGLDRPVEWLWNELRAASGPAGSGPEPPSGIDSGHAATPRVK